MLQIDEGFAPMQLSLDCIKQEVDEFTIKQEIETDASMRQRLFESLSSSFPGSALSRALAAMDDDELDSDPLSRSCFAELRLEKGRMEDEDDEDDELTSLSWLQDTDLLKNLSPACPSPMDDVKENTLNGGTYGQTHPPHVPYNPLKHVNSKPPYSFSCLIFMAIEDSPIKKLPVKDIYNWILTHFPYFRNAPTGWKNSVRHNLSLNKCFKKVEKEKGQGLGKGSLWCIDPIFRPNLLQALRKTPYHPYHQLQMLSSPQPPAGLYTIHGVIPPNGISRPMPLAPKLNINTPSPHLFPFLSKCLNSVTDSAESLADSDIDVANTLMSLKRAAESRRPFKQTGSRSRSPSPPEFGSKREKELLKQKLSASRSRTSIICTPAPSDDHSYCYTQSQIAPHVLSPGSSIDEAYDFGSGDIDDDDWVDAGNKPRKKGSDFDRSHSDIEATDESDTDFEEGGSDGEQRSRVRGLIVKMPLPKRKRKSSSTVPLFKKRAIDPKEEREKIVAGADALLNLASAALALRDYAPSNSNNNNYDKSPGEVKQEAEEES